MAVNDDSKPPSVSKCKLLTIPHEDLKLRKIEKMMTLTLMPETIIKRDDALWASLKMDQNTNEILIANHLDQMLLFGPKWSQKLHGFTVGDICEREVRLSVPRTTTALLMETHIKIVIEQVAKIVGHLADHQESFQRRPTMLTVHRKQQLPQKPLLLAAE